MNLKMLLLGAVIGIGVKEIITFVIYLISNSEELCLIVNYPFEILGIKTYQKIAELNRQHKKFPGYITIKRELLKKAKASDFDFYKWVEEKEKTQPKQLEYLKRTHYYWDFSEKADQEEEEEEN